MFTAFRPTQLSIVDKDPTGRQACLRASELIGHQDLELNVIANRQSWFEDIFCKIFSLS